MSSLTLEFRVYLILLHLLSLLRTFQVRVNNERLSNNFLFLTSSTFDLLITSYTPYQLKALFRDLIYVIKKFSVFLPVAVISHYKLKIKYWNYGSNFSVIFGCSVSKLILLE